MIPVDFFDDSYRFFSLFSQYRWQRLEPGCIRAMECIFRLLYIIHVRNERFSDVISKDDPQKKYDRSGLPCGTVILTIHRPVDRVETIFKRFTVIIIKNNTWLRLETIKTRDVPKGNPSAF